MADIADVASDYSERLIEQQLAEHRAKAASGAGSEDCVSCGVVIPAARRAAARRAAVKGCETCIDCQQLTEARRG